MSQKNILKAQQSSPEPQVDTTIDLDTPPALVARQQKPELQKTPEVQQKQEVVASTSKASTSQAATRYFYRVEEYHRKKVFPSFDNVFHFYLKRGLQNYARQLIHSLTF